MVIRSLCCSMPDLLRFNDFNVTTNRANSKQFAVQLCQVFSTPYITASAGLALNQTWMQAAASLYHPHIVLLSYSYCCEILWYGLCCSHTAPAFSTTSRRLQH